MSNQSSEQPIIIDPDKHINPPSNRGIPGEHSPLSRVDWEVSPSISAIPPQEKPEIELRTRVSVLRDTLSSEQGRDVLDAVLPSLDAAKAINFRGINSLVVKPKEAGSPDLFVIFDDNGDVRLSVPVAAEGEFEDYSLNPTGIFRNRFDPATGTPIREPLDKAESLAVIESLKPYVAQVVIQKSLTY
jgi:hypothetical protein